MANVSLKWFSNCLLLQMAEQQRDFQPGSITNSTIKEEWKQTMQELINELEHRKLLSVFDNQSGADHG